jgi:hypothetical protein
MISIKPSQWPAKASTLDALKLLFEPRRHSKRGNKREKRYTQKNAIKLEFMEYMMNRKTLFRSIPDGKVAVAASDRVLSHHAVGGFVSSNGGEGVLVLSVELSLHRAVRALVDSVREDRQGSRTSRSGGRLGAFTRIEFLDRFPCARSIGLEKGGVAVPAHSHNGGFVDEKQVPEGQVASKDILNLAVGSGVSNVEGGVMAHKS